jgi:putative endonuclease
MPGDEQFQQDFERKSPTNTPKSFDGPHGEMADSRGENIRANARGRGPANSAKVDWKWRPPSNPVEAERRRRANALGAKGELAALEYLEARGAKLLARNYRCIGGEIDLVVLHEGDLVAVEVKTRTLGGLGLPEESLTWSKLKRVARALAMYAFEANQTGILWRIDVVVVDVDLGANVTRVEHFKSVYEDKT